MPWTYWLDSINQVFTAIQNSAYFESVDNVQVPTMTSTTTPSGTCFSSAGQAYYPFDGNGSTYWATNGASGAYANQYVGYTFTKPTKIFKCKVVTANSGDSAYLNLLWKNFKIQGQKSGGSWVDLYTGVHPKQFNITENFILSNVDEYDSYRFLAIDIYGSTTY